MVTQKIIKTQCNSPKNQVCVSVKGNYMNDTIDAYFCSDSCSPGKDNGFLFNSTENKFTEMLYLCFFNYFIGFQTRCCNVSDCNAPPKLSCIKSTGIDKYTPASVECEYGEICLVIYLVFFN